jgi:DNA-binding NarL/FixJ family response regulator/tRNA A-37 threonylcarbamoyl transferase component Bud32
MIGQKLNNRYLIESLLGEGATSTVYRATDTRLGREVAVKVLLPHVHATTRQRFEREARAVAMLNHPSIMTIYDVGQDGNWSYLVVELINGRPLYDLIPSSGAVVADIGRKICLALDYAHKAGLIHRDVKPANIYVMPNGDVKIMDMGLAMPVDASEKRLTATGSIIGTPAYLSPEQAQGKKLDPRTDLYSLGVVLYELVTGQLPFDADDIGAILIQHVSKPATPPSQIVVGIPNFLERAILRALEKQPDARFATAGAMAEALIAPTDQLTDFSETTVAPSVTGSRKIRVVLVDDHAILRATLATVLGNSGEIAIIGQGGDGQQAIDLADQLQPDLILLDLNMPRKSGLAALPELKAAHPEIKVLVLTGRDENAYIMRALRSGANGYMLKTANEHELLQAVRDVQAGGLVLGEGVAERIVQSLRLMDQMDPLNEDERDVLRCIAIGDEENALIAKRLGWDELHTTRTVMSVIDKLGVKSRTDAALTALRAGWISVDDMRV